MNITEAIKQTRKRYLKEGLSASYFEINNGLCDEFARDISAAMEEFGISPDEMCGENFMMGENGEEWENDVWDWKLLKKHWNITPPAGMSKGAMDNIPFGGHVWIFHDGLYYDAECPEGVQSFFDLPLYRRSIVYALRKKGILAADVVTTDVQPAPLCPIPNPVC